MCVHDLVSSQAAATPDAVAIVAGDQQLRYRELDARANQLAHLLRSFGVGPDVPIGLCMARSLDLAIGALAILKAGGAYVPLDPSYPPNMSSYGNKTWEPGVHHLHIGFDGASQGRTDHARQLAESRVLAPECLQGGSW